MAPPHRPSSRPAPRAFTLVEVTLVVAIAAILAAIALPRFRSTGDRYRAELAARKLVADLEWCRMAARARGQTATLTFNASNTSYTLSGAVSGSNNANSDLTVNLADAPFLASVSSVALTLPGTATTTRAITFDADGLPSCAGTVVLQSSGTTRTLTLTHPGANLAVK